MEERPTDVLEEMRGQIAILKDKLATENIVNDRLLRKVVSSSVRNINTQAWLSVAASVFVILAAVLFFPEFGLSNVFIVFTVLMMLFCDFMTWRMHRGVNSRTMTQDLKTVAGLMKRVRKDYQDWLKYGIIICILWGTWFCIEILNNCSDGHHEGLYMVLGAILGGLVGGFIGLRMQRSVVSSCDEVLSQIGEE